MITLNILAIVTWLKQSLVNHAVLPLLQTHQSSSADEWSKKTMT